MVDGPCHFKHEKKRRFRFELIASATSDALAASSSPSHETLLVFRAHSACLDDQPSTTEALSFEAAGFVKTSLGIELASQPQDRSTSSVKH